MNVPLRDDFKFITWLAHFWRALHITMQFGLYHTELRSEISNLQFSISKHETAVSAYSLYGLSATIFGGLPRGCPLPCGSRSFPDIAEFSRLVEIR